MGGGVQLPRGGEPLAPDQIAVVQQPARRAGHGGDIRPPQRQRVGAPIQAAQRAAEGGRGGPSAGDALDAHSAGEILRVGFQMRLVHK